MLTIESDHGQAFLASELSFEGLDLSLAGGAKYICIRTVRLLAAL